MDKHWSGNGHSLHLLPQLEQEARLMTNNLIPYIKVYYGKWATSLFSAEFIAASSGNTWDEERDCIIGTYDDEFDFAAEDDPNLTAIILVFQTNKEKKNIDSNGPIDTIVQPLPANLQRELFGNEDDDSVLTLGTRKIPV